MNSGTEKDTPTHGDRENNPDELATTPEKSSESPHAVPVVATDDDSHSSQSEAIALTSNSIELEAFSSAALEAVEAQPTQPTPLEMSEPIGDEVVLDNNFDDNTPKEVSYKNDNVQAKTINETVSTETGNFDADYNLEEIETAETPTVIDAENTSDNAHENRHADASEADIVSETGSEDTAKKGSGKKLMSAISGVSAASISKVSVPKVSMERVSMQNIEDRAEGWIGRLPEAMQPFARLARWDRPVGFLLLLLPCWIGLAFARIETGVSIWDPYWLLLFALGAFLMRSAGCVWNDITDKDIDAKVERTKDRPLPAGEVKPAQAVGFMGVLLFMALLVWLALPNTAKFVAAGALPLVFAYPYMKRFTWWPQLWLGLTFSWGILLSSAIGGFSQGTMPLYLAMVCWVVAYDTIYAMQDVEDDALVGVKSTARKFGDYATLGALAFHAAAAVLIGFASYLQGAQIIGFILMVLFAFHGLWQAWRVDQSEGGEALAAFKSNVQIGFVLFIGFVIFAFWETIYDGVTGLFGGG